MASATKKPGADGQAALAEYFETLFQPLTGSSGSLPAAREAGGGRECPAVAVAPVPQSVIPVWTFALYGLGLALHRDAVTAIVPWPDVVGPPPAPRPGLVGLMGGGSRVQMIDVSAVIFPPSLRRRLPGEARRPFTHAVVLKERDMALGCHGAPAEATFFPGEMRWHDRKGRRPWLLATESARRTALLDVEALLAALDEGCP